MHRAQRGEGLLCANEQDVHVPSGAEAAFLKGKSCGCCDDALIVHNTTISVAMNDAAAMILATTAIRVERLLSLC